MGPNGNYFGMSQQAYAKQGKKGKKIKILIGLLLAVLVISGVIGFYIKYRIDRKNFILGQLEIVYTELDWTSGSVQCAIFVMNNSLEYIDGDTYGESVTECKKSGENLQSALNELENIINTQEYEELYKTFVAEIESEVVLGDELNKIIDTYSAWRTFAEYSLPETSNNHIDQVEQDAEVLKNANSELFGSWSQKWKEAKTDLVYASLIKDVDEKTKAEYMSKQTMYLNTVANAPKIEEKYNFGKKLSEKSTLNKDLLHFYFYVKENLK